MSIHSELFGNHNLSFSSLEEGLEQIRSAFGEKLRLVNFKEQGPIAADKCSLSESTFYLDPEFAKYSFPKSGEIWIKTDFEQSDTVLIFKHAFRVFRMNLQRANRVMQMYFECYDGEDDKTIHWLTECKPYQDRTFVYAAELATLLGGNTLLVTNESQFPDLYALFSSERATFDEGIQYCMKVREPVMRIDEFRPIALEDIRICNAFKDGSIRLEPLAKQNRTEIHAVWTIVNV